MVLIESMWVRHWAKNLLVLLAPLGAGVLSLQSLMDLGLSFLSLSLAASSTYLVNDMFDRDRDRIHPSKRQRPIATGSLKLRWALFAASGLLILSLALGLVVSGSVFALIVAYTVVSVFYSLWLKKLVALDIVVLAGLFVLRIYVGAAAVLVDVSSWLLATSFFVFFGIASGKRVIELSLIQAQGLNGLLKGRGYSTDDLASVKMGGVASGFSAALLMGMYIESASVSVDFGLPQVLWIAVPLWLFWVSRFWALVSRGEINHDPIEFIVRDRMSYAVLILLFLVYLIAV